MVEHIAALEGEVEQLVEHLPRSPNGEQQVEQTDGVEHPVEQMGEVEQKVEKMEGWKVTQDKRGYYRLVKKINGKVCAVHVGREWSREIAIEKLRAWEKKRTPKPGKEG